MRETDESREDLHRAGERLRYQAQVINTALWTMNRLGPEDIADVRELIDSMRERVDRVEAQMVARIPSVRP
jgi:hypothetical protein